jgi:hypothetical protein
LRDILGRQAWEFLAHLAINLVDCRGIRQEKQLLPDFVASPVRDTVNQRVQDSVPSLVVYKLDPLVLMQLRDHVSG